VSVRNGPGADDAAVASTRALGPKQTFFKVLRTLTDSTKRSLDYA
jgi:hypothetical protein